MGQVKRVQASYISSYLTTESHQLKQHKLIFICSVKATTEMWPSMTSMKYKGCWLKHIRAEKYHWPAKGNYLEKMLTSGEIFDLTCQFWIASGTRLIYSDVYEQPRSPGLELEEVVFTVPCTQDFQMKNGSQGIFNCNHARGKIRCEL